MGGRVAMDVPLFQLRERVIDDGSGVLKRIGNAIAGAYQLGLEHPALFAVGKSGQFAEIIQTRYHRRFRRVTVGILSEWASGAAHPPHTHPPPPLFPAALHTPRTPP